MAASRGSRGEPLVRLQNQKSAHCSLQLRTVPYRYTEFHCPTIDWHPQARSNACRHDMVVGRSDSASFSAPWLLWWWWWWYVVVGTDAEVWLIVLVCEVDAAARCCCCCCPSGEEEVFEEDEEDRGHQEEKEEDALEGFGSGAAG